MKTSVVLLVAVLALLAVHGEGPAGAARPPDAAGRDTGKQLGSLSGPLDRQLPECHGAAANLPHTPRPCRCRCPAGAQSGPLDALTNAVQSVTNGTTKAIGSVKNVTDTVANGTKTATTGVKDAVGSLKNATEALNPAKSAAVGVAATTTVATAAAAGALLFLML